MLLKGACIHGTVGAVWASEEGWPVTVAGLLAAPPRPLTRSTGGMYDVLQSKEYRGYVRRTPE